MNNNNGAQQIPPGYRFFPTEEELISFYLGNKLAGAREEEMEQVIPTVNLYYLDPWQLPAFASVQESEQWFFFCPQQEREAHGGRPARITPSGYWKATGSPGPVYSGASKLIGVKKSMVFYEGKAPRGTKTKWKMNEYRALDETTVDGGSSKTMPIDASACPPSVRSKRRILQEGVLPHRKGCQSAAATARSGSQHRLASAVLKKTNQPSITSTPRQDNKCWKY